MFALKLFAFQMFPLKMFAFIVLFIVLYSLFVKGLIGNAGCNTISYGKSDYDPTYSFLFPVPLNIVLQRKLNQFLKNT